MKECQCHHRSGWNLVTPGAPQVCHFRLGEVSLLLLRRAVFSARRTDGGKISAKSP
jgi:hypothetical protein